MCMGVCGIVLVCHVPEKMSSDTVTQPLERSVCGGFSHNLSKLVHDLLVKFG